MTKKKLPKKAGKAVKRGKNFIEDNPLTVLLLTTVVTAIAGFVVEKIWKKIFPGR